MDSTVIIAPYRSHLITGAVCLVVGILIGLALGWKFYRPVQIVETAKPEVIILEDVVVLERKPEQAPPPKIEKAAKKLGGKLERTATVRIQPQPTPASPADCECEEVKLDVGLVDEGDGKRIVVHTDDATILGGTDNPLEPYNAVKDLKWEVGAIVPVENPEGVGAYVSRKVGPFSVGIQASKPFKEEGYTAMATFGIRF